MDWSRATDVVLALAGGGALKTLLDALASRRTAEVSQSEEAREWAREWRERVVTLESRVAEMERAHALELASRDARIRELMDENERLERLVATLTARVTRLEQDCGS